MDNGHTTSTNNTNINPTSNSTQTAMAASNKALLALCTAASAVSGESLVSKQPITNNATLDIAALTKALDKKKAEEKNQENNSPLNMTPVSRSPETPKNEDQNGQLLNVLYQHFMKNGNRLPNGSNVVSPDSAYSDKSHLSPGMKRKITPPTMPSLSTSIPNLIGLPTLPSFGNDMTGNLGNLFQASNTAITNSSPMMMNQVKCPPNVPFEYVMEAPKSLKQSDNTPTMSYINKGKCFIENRVGLENRKE